MVFQEVQYVLDGFFLTMLFHYDNHDNFSFICICQDGFWLAHPDTIVMIACCLRYLLIACSLPQSGQLAVFVKCGTKVDRPTDIDMLYFGGTARCIDVQ